MVKGFAATLTAGLPAQFAPSLIGTPDVGSVMLTGDLTTLGTDTNDIQSKQSSLQGSIATDLGIASSSVNVGSISVYHPPLPPPSPPPSPGSPPMPPEVPPQSPSHPPMDAWYTLYYENEGCDPDCVGGCRRMRWSHPYPWMGQGLALGLPEEDSIGWPGFKSNVTINRCTTVILDVDINVQMYSMVVWGTLVIENRENAWVTLRTVCIAVKCANPPYCGRIEAGTPTQKFGSDGKGASNGARLEFLMSGD